MNTSGNFWYDIWSNLKRFFLKVTYTVGSARFLALVAGIILIVNAGGWTEDSATKIAGMIIAFIFGKSWEHVAALRNGK